MAPYCPNCRRVVDPDTTVTPNLGNPRVSVVHATCPDCGGTL